MLQNYLPEILLEIKDVLDAVDELKMETLERAVMKERRIFVDGEGRSRYVGQCFAMRLMHLGLQSYVIGDTNTPAFAEGDLLVSISGSGKTETVVLNAGKAKKKGAEVIGITTNSASPLAELSDAVIKLNATTRGDVENRKSIQLLGSLFDQSVHILLDNVCLAVSREEGISNEQATKNHV